MDTSVHRIGHVQPTIAVDGQAGYHADAFVLEQVLRGQHGLGGCRSEQQDLQPARKESNMIHYHDILFLFFVLKFPAPDNYCGIL